MRTLSDDELNRFEDLLLKGHDRAMLGAQAEGFFACLVVCPEFISADEWFQALWAPGKPPNLSPSEINDAIALINTYYKDVADSILSERGYSPIFDVDRDDSFLWEF